ncbi:milk fat globule-EGF factor 8 protein, isoform CRA_b [Mus musculus]|uniref:Milk fat globule EGF and factor V/VIII domain containing n=1 Tax=Mus musculus TaxID=10090 RepID=A0A0U1RNV7_MOUSE|nr:milk fat globule-EGF factor 8 protein, isoform CRA_b [Mus musculus]
MQVSRVLAALCGMLLCASGLFAASGDFCDSSLCLNGGTCLTGQDNDIYCLCPEGWIIRARSMPGRLRATVPRNGCRLTWALRGK